MAFTVGPGNASGEFGLDITFRNVEAENDGRALAENFVEGNCGAAQTDVEQIGFQPFVAGFHADGNAELLAIETFLVSADCCRVVLAFTIGLKLAQKRATLDAQQWRGFALVAAAAI